MKKTGLKNKITTLDAIEHCQTLVGKADKPVQVNDWALYLVMESLQSWMTVAALATAQRAKAQRSATRAKTQLKALQKDHAELLTRIRIAQAEHAERE
jgi:hypothetical protein